MKVHVNYDDARWKDCKVNFESVANIAAGPIGEEAEVSITLTNDAKIQKLNKQYRGFDKPTNVLSFETEDDILWGDIYISYDTVMAEAKNDGKTFEDHVVHMVVHGVLHLMGMDHIDDDEATEMEKTEIVLLRYMGVANPYRNDNVKSTQITELRHEVITNFGENKKMKKKNGLWKYVSYFLLGGVAALGFAPFNIWIATLIGIGGAYYLTIKDERAGFWKSMLQVFPFAGAYGLAMFWWVTSSIFVVPELAAQFAIWTVPALVGLALGGGIIFGIPFAIIRCIRTNPAHRPFLFAAIWTLVLWMREWIFTGFPWNPIANITMPMPVLSNSMSLWGALGLTFVIIGLITSVVEIIRDRRAKNVFIPGVIFSLLLIVGGFMGYKNIAKSGFVNNENTPMIKIIQPATSQEDKATHSQEQAIMNAENNINNIIRLSKNGMVPDLIVLPETTYPYLVTGNTISFVKNLGAPTVVGATSYRHGKFYNSLAVVDKDGNITDIYNKSHLVPFGEYSPLGGLMPSPGNLTPGDGPTVMHIKLASGDVYFAPAVCYEVIFTDSLIPKNGTPKLVVNITNDTWFGKTPGTYQHLDMVRRYAIESGLPIVRSNYSGISAFVASDGAVISQTPIGVPGYLDGTVGGDHDTVYRYIGRDGWMIIILLFAAVAVICIPGSRRKD